ncbi:Metallophosphoesterase MPPED2 [Pteropus alecto]|uniref:Metallophosphoesterase MPPED2 n=1 Tax=Pteropus alecto TaxID=9402 RepID=L5KXW1_PTEAL|nr:Metallophosphoesterase MPPED2 [Pteropus alecto]
MAHGIPSQGKVTITVDEYSSNPTQAFTHYNINQSRFQPPHVHMVDPIPYDTPKPAGHTRFVCISDTHSRTDGIQMPYGDILLHTGDFTELGLPSEVKKFNDWLGNLPYEYKIVIAGNHELTFDKEFMADLVKQDYYRFPSVSKLKPEDFDNVQSLLTNSFRDWVPKELQRVGCVELLNTVQRRVRPKLHVFGGIHEGYGIMTDGYTTYINASTCTVSFQPTNPPIIFDLPNPQGS